MIIAVSSWHSKIWSWNNEDVNVTARKIYRLIFTALHGKETPDSFLYHSGEFSATFVALQTVKYEHSKSVPSYYNTNM
jgi:hypothetical protein